MNRGSWILLVAALQLAACGIATERGSGIPATETLDLSTFSSLRLANQVDLQLDEGSEVAGSLTCDDNLLDNIRIEVDNGRLVIDTPEGQAFRARTECFATITAVGLTGLQSTGSGDTTGGDFAALSEIDASGSGGIDVGVTSANTLDVGVTGSGDVDVAGAPNATTVETTASGSGDLAVAGIEADSVDTTLTGSGGTTLEGTTDDLALTVSGSGDLDARDLPAVDVDVTMSGSGGATIEASGTVTGSLSGSGDLRVRGDATIDVTTTGSGRVR